MIDQRKLSWIRSQKERGYPKHQMYSYLIQQGYNPNEIKDILNSIYSGTEQNRIQSPKKSLGILFPLIIGFVIFLITAGIFLYFHGNDETARQETIVLNFSEEEQLGEVSGELSVDENCDAFPDKLNPCTKYKCQFIHPLTQDLLVKEILGFDDEEMCGYVEEMPNNGKMECEYTESMRKAIVQYYEDLAAAESFGGEINFNLSGVVKAKYTIDGKEVDNPLQEALDNGQCVISGYE